MAKGQLCRISNCKNVITYKGTICGTHKWRRTKYGSYDLPNHKGEPSVYIPVLVLPDNIFKICAIHGELTEDKVYPKYYKGNITSYNCKKCTIEAGKRRKMKDYKGEDDYKRMFDEQNGVCAICKQKEILLSNGDNKPRKLGIDHCHDSRRVRGLLCGFCNSALGYFKDSIEALQSAIDYLKHHKKRHDDLDNSNQP